MEDTKNEKSAGCIVYKRRESGSPLFLVVHDKAHGNWGFPKGHTESGESEKETALRECKEEIGIEVDIKNGFREEISYEMENGITKTVVYFVAKAQSYDVDYSACNEIDDHKWLTMYEAIGRVTFVNAALLVQKARDFLQNSKKQV